MITDRNNAIREAAAAVQKQRAKEKEARAQFHAGALNPRIHESIEMELRKVEQHLCDMVLAALESTEPDAITLLRQIALNLLDDDPKFLSPETWYAKLWSAWVASQKISAFLKDIDNSEEQS